jgi:hypothetical protein
VLHPNFPWSILSQIFYYTENVVASSGSKILLVQYTHVRTYVNFYFFSIFFSNSLDLLTWSGFLPTVPMTYLVVAKKMDVILYFTCSSFWCKWIWECIHFPWGEEQPKKSSIFSMYTVISSFIAQLVITNVIYLLGCYFNVVK